MASKSGNVRNGDQTLRLMREFDKPADRALRKGLRKAVEPIVRKTRQDVPKDEEILSHWQRYGWENSQTRVKSGRVHTRDLSWNASSAVAKVRAVIGGKRRRGQIVSNLVGVASNDAAAAIFELAGHKNPGNPLDHSLRIKGFGGPPRLLLRYSKDEDTRRDVNATVSAAMKDAERHLQRQLDNLR